MAQLYAAFSPTSGKIFLNGVDIQKYSKPICFEIGLVLQYPENQLFCKTVFDDIAFGARNKGIKEENIKMCKRCRRLYGIRFKIAS